MSANRKAVNVSGASFVRGLMAAVLLAGLAPNAALAAGKGKGTDNTSNGKGSKAAATEAPQVAPPATSNGARGLIVLNGLGEGALTLSGNGRILTPGVWVNSASPSAVVVQGNGVIETKSLSIVGSMAASCESGVQGSISCGADAAADPMASKTMDMSDMGPNQGSMKFSGGSHVANPGYYPGGIQLNGHAKVVFQPGVYYVDGPGVKLAGSIATGQEVTFVVLNGSMETSGQAMISISPTTSGSFAGVSVYQPSTNTSPMRLSGGSFMALTGTVYAPGAEVTVVGNGELGAPGSFYGDLVVANSVRLSGQGVIRIGDRSSFLRPPAKIPAD